MVPAGSVVLFNSRLLHGARRNQHGSRTRYSLCLGDGIRKCSHGSIHVLYILYSINGSIKGSINVHMVCAICMLNTRICCLSFAIFVIFVRFVQDNPVSLSKHEKIHVTK